MHDASANAVATAASTAVPPSLIVSAPMREAISFCDATMPRCARHRHRTAPAVSDSAAQTTTTMKNLDLA